MYVDVCKLNDFLGMNGRKIGDVFGNLTSRQWNGSSVVAYFLPLNTFTQNIFNFSVGKYIPWLSDHCPIHTIILMNCGRQEVNQAPKNALKDIQEVYIWDRKSRDRYLADLKSHINTERISKLSVSANGLKPCEIIKEIDEVLFSKSMACAAFFNNYENHSLFIHKKIFQTLPDRRDESKLRTYALFKNEIGLEILAT